jgi:prefoldin subunit 5
VLRQDYVKRLIEELGRALARIAGLESEPAKVLDEVEQAKGLVPLVPGLLERSSVQVVVQLVGSHEVLRQLADLYRHQAHALEAEGRTVEAARCLRRCLELLQHLEAAQG